MGDSIQIKKNVHSLQFCYIIRILYMYITELKKNNHFTFHFSGINKKYKFEKIGIDMTDCIRTLLNN